jgi:predicted dehydrogenase
MRIAVLSYSHHGRGIAVTVKQLGHEVVAVMDPEADPRGQLEQEFDCPGFADSASCLDAVKPDAAIVCGKHVEIPGHVAACVERRVPYLLDKPFADCADRLRPAAEATMAAGLPHALTLPNRGSLLIEKVAQMVADGSLGDLILYSSRLNNGPPTRYDPTPSHWLNKPALSGGGSWVVESSHGIDTFLQFAGDGPVTVVGGVIANLMHRREVEDTAVGIVRTAAGVTGIIESGFNYPSGTRAGDHFFRFVGSKASVFERYGDHGEPLIEVHTSAGVEITPDIGHGERMHRVIEWGLQAIAAGRIGDPDVMQAVRVLEVQDAVYDHLRSNAAAAGPYPLGAPPAR